MTTIRPFAAQTLVDLLGWRATQHPDHLAFIFLVDGEREELKITYGALERRARAVAALLQREAVPGARALLLCEPGIDYIVSFFGALYAGIVPVPLYPPLHERGLGRVELVAADSGAAMAITNGHVLTKWGNRLRLRHLAALGRIKWLTPEESEGLGEELWKASPIDGESLAFLQYTSGSTAAPKGVMVRHADVLRHAGQLAETFGFTRDDVSALWLPPFHDMGLIGGILMPLYVGTTSVLMPPAAFLQRPYRWLQALSRYRASHTAAPNFAYDLCVRTVAPEQREALRLDALRVAFSGGEPVRAETLDQFTAAFAGCGFRREAFYPGFGLAEATLTVSGGRAGAGPRTRALRGAELGGGRAVAAAPGEPDVRVLVSCGRPLAGQQVVVVDPERAAPVAPEEVGELWVAGPNVAKGYWDRPEETERTFRARLDGDERQFLRTGDLGFVHDGEVFVVGRVKDLIIIRGVNHHPQDIELTVEGSHPALRPGGGAAFSIDAESEEQLAVVQEVGRARDLDTREILAAVRLAIVEHHGIQPYAVTLVRLGGVARTSSGKVQRHVVQRAFLEGSLEAVADWRRHADPPALRTPVREVLPDRPAAGAASAAATLARDVTRPPVA